ncbi:MAG: DUF2064 domain-containing protein [Wenzhouxiangellaceae bacterium]|nr:DUF2064 domain-containing protein [Wenzhouxiangellaceae bacterium]
MSSANPNPAPACAVAIFVKTPGHSPIKTRLAAVLGRETAEDWHRRAAACVAEVGGAAGLPIYWAVAEAGGLDHPLWRNLPRIGQPEGSLGLRMAGVHTALVRRHGSAILVGADLPQLEPHHLRFAADWLTGEASRSVLGPAHDGGFWLFGANHAIDAGTWDSVRYSRSDTAREFLRSVDTECAWEMLEPLTDLDEPDDLGRVLAELRAINEPLPCQRRLIDWLAQCLERAA